MSLKLRLTLAVVALLAIMTGVLGYAVIAVNNAAAIARIDDRLDRFVSSPVPRDVGQAPTQPQGRGGSSGRGGDASTVVYVWSPPTQTWFTLVPDLGDLLDDPPLLPTPGTSAFESLTREAGTLSSQDGDSSYRARADVDTAGRYRIVVAPLEDAERTSRDLIAIVVIAGLVTVVLGGIACYWVIRRGLRPVDRMVDTAQAIASGDRAQRIDAVDDGTELGRLGAALDEMLTRLDADAAERERANERLRRFVADASHELRTPVAAVRGYAELFLSGGVPAGKPSDQAMRRIETESLRMGMLIDDLLLLTRMDRDQPLSVSQVDLTAVVRDAVEAFGVIHPTRRLDADLQDGARVSGEAMRLRQVVDNLLGNAVAHTPDDAQIAINVRSVGESLVLVVQDDGPGIPVDQREAVFERFTRLDGSRTRSTGGAGLGLSIVRSVVEAHGGQVRVDGAAGGGARFVVTLPRLASPPTSGTAQQSMSATGG